MRFFYTVVKCREKSAQTHLNWSIILSKLLFLSWKSMIGLYIGWSIGEYECVWFFSTIEHHFMRITTWKCITAWFWCCDCWRSELYSDHLSLAKQQRLEDKWKTMSCIVCFLLLLYFIPKCTRFIKSLSSFQVRCGANALNIYIVCLLFISSVRSFLICFSTLVVYLSSQCLCCCLLKLWSQHVIVIWSI